MGLTVGGAALIVGHIIQMTTIQTAAAFLLTHVVWVGVIYLIFIGRMLLKGLTFKKVKSREVMVMARVYSHVLGMPLGVLAVEYMIAAGL